MPDEEERMASVELALGHSFRDAQLLRDALTHRSYANERRKVAPRDNETLEFLGDAVAGMLVSSLLWEAFPDAREGELTRRRADLVCEARLAEIARELGIGPALRVGRGEMRSGGRDKPRLLASALEACLAAVYLDGSLEAAQGVGKRVFGPRLGGGDPGAGDFKSRVQERVQAMGEPPPRYEVVGTEGPDHERRFRVAILIGGREFGVGHGRSKIEAEQLAAKEALTALESAETEGPEEDRGVPS